MAESNCSSPSSPSPVIITSSSENAKGDVEQTNPISSSCDSRITPEKEEKTPEGSNFISQSPNSSSNSVFCDSAISSSNESSNGVQDSNDKSSEIKSSSASSILRPSALSGGLNSSSTRGFSDSTKANSPFGLKCPLKSPKLNLTPSKFGSLDQSTLADLSLKLPSAQSKNPFNSSVSFEEKNDSLPASSTQSRPDANSTQSSGSPNIAKPTLGAFTTNTNSHGLGGLMTTNSAITVPNFVFGQNLHERVTDGIKASDSNDSKPQEASTSNGTSDMLFTSVLTSKELANKESTSSDVSSNSKESSSLLEDADRCQKARANKRKYEEVLVTTGEEGEENILQMNVKLFAFDNGTWVERGRGTLRLNDKSCEGVVTSRIVIRTMGSLRVVLNTKIWSGMTLNQASDRSIRLTAMDPNGQLKIFLIQSSPKDIATLYRYMDSRMKRCQERDPENQESPEKKLALDNTKT